MLHVNVSYYNYNYELILVGFPKQQSMTIVMSLDEMENGHDKGRLPEDGGASSPG